MVKPDGVILRLEMPIMSMVRESGLRIESTWRGRLSADDASYLYAQHRDKPFFPELVRFTTAGEVMLMLVSGEDAVRKLTKLKGAANFSEAERDPSTIRGRFLPTWKLFPGIKPEVQNLFHASDADGAEREVHYFTQSNPLLALLRTVPT